jgi:hypothetical protein
MYYKGFIDGCVSVEGNTEEVYEKFTSGVGVQVSLFQFMVVSDSP